MKQSVEDYKDESGAVPYVSEKRKIICHTKVSPYLVSVLQQLKNRIWEARFDRQKADSILRACCRADYDTDGVNNRKRDVLACTFVRRHLLARFNTVQQAGDEGFSTAAEVSGSGLTLMRSEGQRCCEDRNQLSCIC